MRNYILVTKKYSIYNEKPHDFQGKLAIETYITKSNSVKFDISESSYVVVMFGGTNKRLWKL